MRIYAICITQEDFTTLKNRLDLNFQLETAEERNKFVQDYLPTLPFTPNQDELETISNYILDFGTVSVTAKDVNGYTIQVTDVSSEKKTVSSDSESFDLRSYPGSWKVIVYDENGTEKIKNIYLGY